MSITAKELAPGIILHKQVIPAAPQDPYECTFEYKVEVQKLNSVEFTADFTESKNLSLQNETSSLAKTTVIHPFTTQSVALLKMKK